MERTISEYIQMCEWDSAKLLIFSDNVFGNLVYYSHLLPLVVLLFLAIFVFFKNPKLLASRWFLVTSILLSIWLFSDLVLWASEVPSLIMFFWSMLVLIEPMIYAGMLFFVYAFVDGRDISFSKKAIVFALLLPTVILTPTNLALTEFDLTNCWREAIEGNLAYYGYILEVILALWILVVGMERYRKLESKVEKNKAILVSIGAVFFLLSFAMGNVVGSLLVDWEIGQYGLFGIPVFAVVLAYLIVKYHAFDAKVIGTQFLIAALWVLTLGILFLRKIETVRVVGVVTLLLFTILGYLLIRSVKREVKQREELAVANAGQENLIHIMNHQIKGYLTKARNIFAELKSEPDYCAGEAAKPMLEEGFKSLTEGVEFVQQVLQGSSASSGKLVYNLLPQDFNKLVLETAEKQRGSATDKKLTFDVKTITEPLNIKADDIQLKEAVRNLIDNSIRYTQAGGLTITTEKSGNKALLKVVDTGVGISTEDKQKLFQKGGRGKDSLKYNVNSTGYGLAFVKGVVEAHKGRVWAESAGTGKGSTFYLELPLV